VTAQSVADDLAKGPGRPRDPEADRAILRATLELLVELGYEGLSIEAIAARAGVGKTTIYRRWTSKEPLVVEAIKSFKAPSDPAEPAQLAEDEPTRDVLVRVVGGFVRSMGPENTGAMMAGLVAAMSRNPGLAQAVRRGLIEHRRSIVMAILKRGVERGEIRSDVDLELVADLFGGPVIMRVLLTGRPIGGRLARQIFDTVLDGAAAKSS
jgi:AcrR family transcriptional regulator